MTRMYINVFRDTNRQAAIDIMQGLDPDLSDLKDDKSEVCKQKDSSFLERTSLN